MEAQSSSIEAAWQLVVEEWELGQETQNQTFGEFDQLAAQSCRCFQQQAAWKQLVVVEQELGQEPLEPPVVEQAQQQEQALEPLVWLGHPVQLGSKLARTTWLDP